jgi:hypothetical protein
MVFDILSMIGLLILILGLAVWLSPKAMHSLAIVLWARAAAMRAARQAYAETYDAAAAVLESRAAEASSERQVAL